MRPFLGRQVTWRKTSNISFGPMWILIKSWISELEAMEVSMYYFIACLNGVLDGLLILDHAVWFGIVGGYWMLDFIGINLFLLCLWVFFYPLKSCHSVSSKSFLSVCETCHFIGLQNYYMNIRCACFTSLWSSSISMYPFD